MTLKGQDQLPRNLVEVLGDFAIQAGRVALMEEAETIMTEAKLLCPVDTGALRGSGTVFPPELEGDKLVVTLGFGGPAVDYAIIVHEDLNAHHTVGQAKFLETPMLAHLNGIETRLATRMQLEYSRMRTA